MFDRQSKKGSRRASSRRPRFLQIADKIRSQVATGTLKEHDSLPSERSLAEDFGVSRMTGRRALEALEAEGLVYSSDRRGRFVSPKRLKYNISNMISFVGNAQSNDVGLQIELVGSTKTTANSRLAALLERPLGSGLIEYTRLFFAGGHPAFIETEYLPAEQFPDFLTHDLTQSTTQILEQSYSVLAGTGDIVIRMRGVHASEADLLGIAANHGVIELEQVIRDDNGVPFCFGRQVWRGEMAEFSAHAIVAGPHPGRA